MNFIPQELNVAEALPLPATEEFSNMTISTDQELSIVPITLGSRRKPSNEVSKLNIEALGEILITRGYLYCINFSFIMVEKFQFQLNWL